MKTKRENTMTDRTENTNHYIAYIVMPIDATKPHGVFGVFAVEMPGRKSAQVVEIVGTHHAATVRAAAWNNDEATQMKASMFTEEDMAAPIIRSRAVLDARIAHDAAIRSRDAIVSARTRAIADQLVLELVEAREAAEAMWTLKVGQHVRLFVDSDGVDAETTGQVTHIWRDTVTKWRRFRVKLVVDGHHSDDAVTVDLDALEFDPNY